MHRQTHTHMTPFYVLGRWWAADEMRCSVRQCQGEKDAIVISLTLTVNNSSFDVLRISEHFLLLSTWSFNTCAQTVFFRQPLNLVLLQFTVLGQMARECKRVPSDDCPSHPHPLLVCLKIKQRHLPLLLFVAAEILLCAYHQAPN